MDKPDSPTKLGPVEMYFKTYFEFLGSFSCDKAKDFAEKQKEQHLPTPLQMAFVTLSQNEKLYYSLAFSQQKAWFGRREPTLRNAYVSLKDTFINIQKHEQKDIPAGSEKVEDLSSSVSLICVQLAEFCAARAECINLYTHISKSLSAESLDQIQKDVAMLIASFATQLSFLFLEPLKERIVEELSLLTLLLRSCQSIMEWKFIDAMCGVQEITFLLSKWKPLLAKSHSSSSFRSGFFSFGDKSNLAPTSALFDWFEKFAQFLIAKFTFYFYESLSREANSEEMKSFCSKTNFDFVAKTLSFIRKNDVTSVLLLFDVLHHNDELLHHGYSLPDFRSENTNDVSVEGFFPVLCLPNSSTSFTVDDVARLLRHKLDEFHLDKIVTTQSADRKISMFSVQLEKRLYIVVSYVDRKHDKDNAVSVFLNEIMQQTKLKKMAALLKPGYK